MLNIGDKAPDFTLQTSELDKITLSTFEGDKNVLLLFFPLAFSGVCTDEMCGVRDNMKIYDSLNAKVIGVSVDSAFSLREFKKTQNLNFTLASDFNKETAKAYDTLYDEFFGNRGVAKRSAFVIDREGIIKYAAVSDDASVIPDFTSISKVLEELG